MQARTKAGFVVGSLGAAMLALPLRLADPAEGLIRVNDACGQASECGWKPKYICSTHHEDHKDYECTKGCDT